MDYKKYITEKMKGYQGRLSHILGVQAEAVRLAKLYGLDEEKASIMGYLHDIAKKLDDQTMRDYMIKAGYDLKIPKKIWHAYVGEYIVRDELKIVDEEILRGIKYHPTCTTDMTDLMKVLMLADITEKNTRTAEISILLREIQDISLNRAIAVKLKYMIEVIETPDQNTLNSYQQYKKYME